MERKKYTKWLMLFLMCCTFAVTFITRFVWTPLNATVSEELGLTAVQAGAFMSAFFVGYVITQIPGGYLADRIGVKWVLSAGILLSGVASLGMAYITSYGPGFVLRVITGLGGGVFMACATKVIADNFPNLKERGIAFGILQVGATVGSLVSNNMGAALLEAYGWQTAFRVTGYIAIAFAVVIFLVVPNIRDKENARKITLITGLKITLSNRNVLMICLGSFFFSFMIMGIGTWSNRYLTNIGFTTSEAAYIWSFNRYAGIVATLLTGFIASKLHMKIKNYLILCYVVLAVSIVLFGFQSSYTVLIFFALLLGFFQNLPNAIINTQVTRFAPEGTAASVMGVQNTIFQLASTLSPIVVGYIVDTTGAFSICWYVLAAALLVGIVFLALIQEEKPA